MPGQTKTAEQMNQERRAAKARQKAAAKAAKVGKNQRQNIYAGFKFERDDSRAMVLERQRRQAELEKARQERKLILERGKATNRLINRWLDDADRGAVIIRPQDVFEAQALMELVGWLAQNQDRYYTEPNSDRYGISVARIKQPMREAG